MFIQMDVHIHVLLIELIIFKKLGIVQYYGSYTLIRVVLKERTQTYLKTLHRMLVNEMKE